MKTTQVTKILLLVCINMHLQTMDEVVEMAQDNRKAIEITLENTPEIVEGFELIRLADNRYPTFQEFLQENLEEDDYGKIMQEAFDYIIHAMHLLYIPRFITSRIDMMQINDPFIRCINYAQEHRDGFMRFAIPQWMHEVNLLGETLLHKVVLQNNISAMPILLSFGADINAQNNCGRTPLHAAVINGYYDAVTNLISLGANYNMQDIHNKTPLHNAVSNEDKDMVNILLQAHADTQIIDNHADNACAFARKIRNGDIANMIENHNNQLYPQTSAMEVFDMNGDVVNA